MSVSRSKWDTEDSLQINQQLRFVSARLLFQACHPVSAKPALLLPGLPFRCHSLFCTIEFKTDGPWVHSPAFVGYQYLVLLKITGVNLFVA